MSDTLAVQEIMTMLRARAEAGQIEIADDGVHTYIQESIGLILRSHDLLAGAGAKALSGKLTDAAKRCRSMVAATGADLDYFASLFVRAADQLDAACREIVRAEGSRRADELATTAPPGPPEEAC